MKNWIFICVALYMIICSCKNSSKQELPKSGKVNALHGMLVADTIIYDVIIRNTNPEDSWTESCLEGLKRTELIDSIFELIYKEEVIAHDFDTHQPLKIKDIRKLEEQEDFARDRIGKIQFKEKWIFNTDQLTFTKEIISMVFGYEIFDDSGELRGYKPAFRINFNPVAE